MSKNAGTITDGLLTNINKHILYPVQLAFSFAPHYSPFVPFLINTTFLINTINILKTPENEYK